MCRTTAPTGSDGNECGDDKEAKSAYQTTENEMVEPREGRVLSKAQEILAFVTPKMNYEELEADQFRLAKEELRDTSGGGQFLEKETWWWNQWVKKTTKAKTDSFEKWQHSGEKQDREPYKVKKMKPKTVAMPKRMLMKICIRNLTQEKEQI